MKKCRKSKPFAGVKDLSFLFLAMKLCALFLTICCIHLHAHVYSQGNVSVHLTDVSIKKVLQHIQKHSDYRFIYDDELLQGTPPVSVQAHDQPLESVLKTVMEPNGLQFKAVNQHLIVILPTQSNRILQDSVLVGKIYVRDTDGQRSVLPGAVVKEMGTSNAIATDQQGNFSLTVSKRTMRLEVSHIGYTTLEVAIVNGVVPDITLEPATQVLKDVVVTALGITREKKSLTYSTQTVSGETLSNARESNVTSAMNGRVAGLNIYKTNAGPGSSNRIVFRGNRSITGNNQPLIVVDGVRIDNTSKAVADVTLFGARDNGDGISNINADDIASMTVLTGPSAAALYGSDASNGAIIITTKTGKKSEGPAIQVSSSYFWETPMTYPHLQNKYGQGEGGIFSATSDQSWGPEMTGQQETDWTGKTQALLPQPDNFKDFFRTGGEALNTISLSRGNEIAQTYASYTNTFGQGIIPTNDFRRNNINVRQTTRFLPKLVSDLKINYIHEDVINRQASGEANRAVSTLYRIPRSIRLDDVKNFETVNDDGTLTQNYWRPESPSMQNPYWSIYRNLYDRTRDRLIGLVSLQYEFSPSLTLLVRSSLDFYRDDTEERNYNDSYWLNTVGKGNYQTGKEENRQFNNDMLLTYNRDLGPDFSLHVNAGASIEQFYFGGTYTNNQGLSVPNLFALTNAISPAMTSALQRTEKQSVYAAANLGYRNYLFFDVSARNDWNSTLPAANRSYFFPSVGANILLNELLNMAPAFSLFKLRASYAYVGNGTRFNMLKPIYSMAAGGSSGFLLIDRTLRNEDLKPEQTRSFETGIDVSLLNRFSLSATFYKSNTINQILTIGLPNPSGYAFRIINAGNIQNAGTEIQLEAKPINRESFSWDIHWQFGLNKNRVLELDPLQKQPPLSSPDRIAVLVVEEGKRFGEIYTRGFVRNEQGQIVVGENGLPLTTEKDHYAGNFNPDWTSGISNSLRYRNWNLSFLVDMRKGGAVVSHTQALLAGAGDSEMTADRAATFVVPNSAREDGSPNTIAVSQEDYWTHVGGVSDPIGEAFVYDATNIRLREVSLSYNLPDRWLKGTFLNYANITLVGRNLFFLHNKAYGFDPESALGTGNNQGIEYTSTPSTRNYGIHLKFGF